MSQTKNRIVSFDIIRIIAILAVVMIHATGEFLEKPAFSSEFIFGDLLNLLSRIGVPLFVMLSGALMLDENREMPNKKLAKNTLRLVFLLVFWSLLYAGAYYIFIPLMRNESVSFANFFSNFLLGHYHLWYLYMIIGLYLISPILRKFVKKENKNTVLYFIILALIFSFSVPILNIYFNEFNYSIGNIFGGNDLAKNFLDSFHLSFVGQYTAYFLAGWYIANVEIKNKHRRAIYCAGILSLVFSVVSKLYFTNDQNKETVFSLFHQDIALNIFIYSLALFVFLFYMFKDKKFEKSSKLLTSLSNLSFGVYVIHVFVLDATRQLNIDSLFLKIPVNFIVTTVTSFALVFVMSKIPVLKKIIKS